MTCSFEATITRMLINRSLKYFVDLFVITEVCFDESLIEVGFVDAKVFHVKNCFAFLELPKIQSDLINPTYFISSNNVSLAKLSDFRD